MNICSALRPSIGLTLRCRFDTQFAFKKSRGTLNDSQEVGTRSRTGSHGTIPESIVWCLQHVAAYAERFEVKEEVSGQRKVLRIFLANRQP